MSGGPIPECTFCTTPFPTPRHSLVESLHIAPFSGAPIESVPRIEVVAGMGVVGDRNFGKSLAYGQNLTLIEAEEVEDVARSLGIDLDPRALRRTVVVRGARLNELVGRAFQLGGVSLRGVELCEPCATLGGYLAGTGLRPPEVIELFRGRAGLRSDCLAGGAIEIGDLLVSGVGR